jgi:signal transduction histidine kinase/CheY-like chemotaxis protein/HAMP domain-containing protein
LGAAVFISLRLKVLFFYLLLGLLPLGLAGWSLIMLTQDELKSAVNDRLLDTTGQFVKDINALYQIWHNDFMLLRNAIDTPKLGSAEKIALLENGVTHIDSFIALQLMVEGFPPALMLKHSFSAHLGAARAEDILPLPPLSSAAREVFFSTSHPLPIADIRVLPLVSALDNLIGGKQAYLIVYVDLAAVRGLLETHSFGKYGDIFVLDEHGQVLFSRQASSQPITSAILAHTLEFLRSGAHAVSVAAFTENDGRACLGAYGATVPLPWAVAVGVSETEAYQTLSRMRLQLLLWLGGGLLAAITMAWWFSRRITRPVLAVAAVAQRIGAGDLSARVEPQAAHDEIKRLGLCINDMGRGLMALHAAGAGIFQYDSRQDKYFWDARSFEIFGFDPAHAPLSYKDWLACIHPDDVETVKRQIQQGLHESGAFDVEYRIVYPQEQLRYVRSQGFRVNNEELSLVSGLHSDISARKQAESELVRARERAEAANRAKSAFLANMSHELRTPLNAILGYAQILEQDPRLGADHRHSVEIMHRSGDYLLTLINDTLDLAKIEAGRFELFPAPCNLRLFFLGLVEIFAIRAQQKGISFHYQEDDKLPEAVICDDKRLRQTLLNLLGNAIKFTEKGQVILRTYYHDGILSVVVADSGIGIAADQLKQIFEPFSQAGSSDYKMQGTGLGLSITRKLIQLMGGELRVESILDQGSTFSIHLPAAIAHAPACATHETRNARVIGYRRTHGSVPLRLLVADDVTENRDILVRLLQPLGFVMAEAADGRACLEMAQQWQPDAVLIDIVMPEMSGLEVARALRTDPAFADTAIIALSASVFAEDRSHSIAAGCNEHLPKPFQSEDLFHSLEKYLPLEWQYAVDPTASPPLSEAPEHLAEADLEYLLERVKRGDIKGLREYLETLEKQGNAPVTVAKLQDLNKHFKLKEVRALLESFT